jgi:hypothetical protein
MSSSEKTQFRDAIALCASILWKGVKGDRFPYWLDGMRVRFAYAIATLHALHASLFSNNISLQNADDFTGVSCRLEGTPRRRFSIAANVQIVNRTPHNFGRANQDVFEQFSTGRSLLWRFTGGGRYWVFARIGYEFLSHWDWSLDILHTKKIKPSLVGEQYIYTQNACIELRKLLF